MSREEADRRIGRWAGKNRIDCLNRSGKSRTDCRIVRFESRVVHAEASPTPDTPDLHSQTQQPEVCRGTRTAAIQSCRRMFFLPRNTQKPVSSDTKGGCEKTSSPCFNHDSTSPRPINGRDGRVAILCARVHRRTVCGRAEARPSQRGQTWIAPNGEDAPQQRMCAWEGGSVHRIPFAISRRCVPT